MKIDTVKKTNPRTAIYMIVHLLLLLEFPVLTESATRAASVKASLTPRLRFAEHSVQDISIDTSNGRWWQMRITQIAECLDSSGNIEAFFVVNHVVGLSRLRRILVLVVLLVGSQIAFQGHQNQLHSLAIFCNLTDPLRFNVFERVFGIDLFNQSVLRDDS